MKHSVLILFVFTSLASAQRNLKEIPATDPSEQMRSFQLAEGLEINLFASEPLVRKPIQMAWDERGRLWVASSAIYPHIKPGQTQSDQILILEDTDRDGKADKSTVFYEGLLIPTGIWPQDGGVYVANSTELIFMMDTDGDGKADQSKVLLSGFGTEDTHHILHTIKGGPDGNLYFNQSVYIHSHIETPFGVRRLKGTGIWQYQPRTGRLEVFSMGQINPWGTIFDDWGQSFSTDGAGSDGIHYVFPGATYRCLPNQLPRVLKGMNPGQPKHCGLTQITGSHFSAEWQGQLITCDFRGHRVNRFALTDSSSGYRSQQLPDLINSTHGSFRPVDVNIGPDGALYLADWFNPIIQHGEVDFRDPRRDQVHGRIWRITQKNRATAATVDWKKLSPAELFEQLKLPDPSLRYWVRQEIKSRKIDKLSTLLDEFLKKNSTPLLIAECIFTLQTAGEKNMPWIMKHGWLDGSNGNADHPETRAIVVRALRQMIVDDGLQHFTDEGGKPLSIHECEAIFRRFCTDPHPRVRLEAVNLLRAWGTPRAIEIATSVLKQPMDENIDFALWLGCYQLSTTWLPALHRGEISFADNSQGLVFALKAANQPDASGLLLDIVEKNSSTETQRIDLLTIVGTTVDQKNINRVLALATSPQSSAKLRAAALRALIVAAQQRQLRPAHVAALLPMLSDPDASISQAAIQLAALWKLEAARPQLETIARSTGSQAAAAQKSIARLSGEKSSAFLTTLLSSAKDPAQQADVLTALMQHDLAKATPAVMEFLIAQSKATAATAAMFEGYLTRQDGPFLLANALQGNTLHRDIASQALQKTSASGGDTKALMEALTKAGSLTPITALDEAQMKTLIEEVTQRGDAARGETIYRRLELQCMACHAIGPVGGKMAPDLLSIGSSAPVDYIIDSLLLPSKKIKEGYATAMIQMKDGTNHTGFLTREDDKEILLTDAAGHARTLPKTGVSKKEIIPVSLMPAGLTNSLRRDELTDLVRFLSELGKEGTYKVQENGTLRQWSAHRDASLNNPTPLIALVNGTLPIHEIPVIESKGKRIRIVETKFEVITDGPVVIEQSIDPPARWEINGREMFPQDGKLNANLPKGQHTLRVSLPELSQTAPRARLTTPNAKPIH
jgi:putative heme-binding domain-containing protein